MIHYSTRAGQIVSVDAFDPDVEVIEPYLYDPTPDFAKKDMALHSLDAMRALVHDVVAKKSAFDQAAQKVRKYRKSAMRKKKAFDGVARLVRERWRGATTNTQQVWRKEFGTDLESIVGSAPVHSVVPLPPLRPRPRSKSDTLPFDAARCLHECARAGGRACQTECDAP